MENCNPIETLPEPPKKTSGMAWDLSKLKISNPNNDQKSLSRVRSKALSDDSIRTREEFPVVQRRQARSMDIVDHDNARPKYTGRCKAWYTEKGFGFIRCDEDNSEYFCHFTSIIKRGFKALEAGDMVRFDLCDNHRKVGSKMCTNVTLV